jgi:hypothetical protein
MTERRDPDRLIKAFLMEGQTDLAAPVYDAVRATIERKGQRAVIGPWRMPDMNKFFAIGLGTAAVVVALVIGNQLFGRAAAGGVGGAPPAEPTATPLPTPAGGVVHYQLDGAPATTEVVAVADGGSLSGTAVTTLVGGTHSVRLRCATTDGDLWAVAGTTEQTTVPGERAGDWSAVIVKDGQPQHIALWLGEDPSAASDCDGWLASIDLAGMDPANFPPVESGALVPPPGLAP